jgi:hypothetical protein
MPGTFIEEKSRFAIVGIFIDETSRLAILGIFIEEKSRFGMLRVNEFSRSRPRLALCSTRFAYVIMVC